MPTVFITGAANGIGKALVDFFFLKNYNIIAADIAFKETEISENLLKIQLDVRDFSQWESVFQEATDRFTSIDILINNAGVIHPEFAEELSTKSVDNQVDVNIKGVLYGSKLAIEQMRKQKGGHLINIASLAGVAPIQGLSIYAATKYAVRGFTLSIARNLKKYNIAVSVVCPDLVDTNMLTQQLHFSAADITFSGNKTLKTDEVVNAIWERAINRKEVEILIPRSRGILAKIGNTFPKIADSLTSIMQAKGEKKRLELIKVCENTDLG